MTFQSSTDVIVARMLGVDSNTVFPNMIAGYFLDMRNIFSELKKLVRVNGKCVIIVGTSSYCGVTIPTDLLIAKYAKESEFELDEIRILRNLKRSSKQSNSQNGILPPLRESDLPPQRIPLLKLELPA